MYKRPAPCTMIAHWNSGFVDIALLLSRQFWPALFTQEAICCHKYCSVNAFFIFPWVLNYYGSKTPVTEKSHLQAFSNVYDCYDNKTCLRMWDELLFRLFFVLNCFMKDC